ncbi:MAG: hypothetical protein ACRCXQ_09225 [Vagococcus fluvialis]
MKEFRHNHIIRKYSKLYTVTRKVKGPIVGGKPTYTEENFDCLLAIKEIKPQELQDFSGFKLGDIKVYIIKNQLDTCEQSDTFEIDGNKYKLQELRNNFLYPDYLFFIGVKEVV